MARRTRTWRGIAGLGIGMALLAGCGGIASASPVPTAVPTEVPTPFPSPVAANTVDIQNYMFKAPAVTVPVGTTVTWTQRDIDLHTVTAADKSFDSGELENGKTWAWTFKAAGTYSYVCALHPFMRGEVVVTK